jgi:hypothetical protein
MKTARFSDVVAKSGRPEVHLTWTAPASDPVLQHAAREHRVMTVHQHLRGAKKDFATVGLEPAPEAQYLVFPKSLRTFDGSRVVGIRYDLLADAVSVGAEGRPPKRPKRSAKKPAGNNVIHFPMPQKKNDVTGTPIREKPSSRMKPGVAPEEKEQKEEDKDPLRKELSSILGDLEKNRIPRAKSRLRKMLRTTPWQSR